jgi:hypothetical protein
VVEITASKYFSSISTHVIEHVPVISARPRRVRVLSAEPRTANQKEALRNQGFFYGYNGAMHFVDETPLLHPERSWGVSLGKVTLLQVCDSFVASENRWNNAQGLCYNLSLRLSNNFHIPPFEPCINRALNPFQKLMQYGFML